jgi:Flp pilus assembly pilin Flp
MLEAKRVAKLIQFVKHEMGREDGQALVEYGLILALIALVAVVGLTTMSSGVDGMYQTVRGVADAMADRLDG